MRDRGRRGQAREQDTGEIRALDLDFQTRLNDVENDLKWMKGIAKWILGVLVGVTLTVLGLIATLVVRVLFLSPDPPA